MVIFHSYVSLPEGKVPKGIPKGDVDPYSDPKVSGSKWPTKELRPPANPPHISCLQHPRCDPGVGNMGKFVCRKAHFFDL